MASVNGVSGNNLNSIYGNRNILTGLASGLDTEAMIENSIKGFQLRISALQQQQTKLSWKQDAYRGITDSLVQLSQKYTSYTSPTNLLSASYFNKSVLTTANGVNAEKVSASGRSSSDIQLNGVAQLATASRYVVSSGGVLGTQASNSIQASGAINFADDTKVSKVSGSLSLTYGKQSITLNFASDELFETGAELAEAINNKLAEESISFSNGNSKSASEVIQASFQDGKISFSDISGANNSLYLSGATGNMSSTFRGSEFTPANNITSLNLGNQSLTAPSTIIDQISGASMSFNFNGTTKNITLPTAEQLREYVSNSADPAMTQEKAFTEMLQSNLDRAFGSAKVSVTNSASELGKLQLGFSVENGSTLTVNSSAASALGLSSSDSTFLNRGKTLGELLGNPLNDLSGTLLMAEGALTKQANGSYLDAKGNLVNADGERLGKDGNLLYSYDLNINGVKIGEYTRDTALDTVLLAINSNTDAGVNVSYSNTTNQFIFTASETGAGRQIDIGSGLGEAIFGTFNAERYTQGQDAVAHVTVNGSNLTLTRSSNTFDLDGLSITLNGSFNSTNGVFDFASGGNNYDIDNQALGNLTGAVSFTTKADSDKIVDDIKSMVTDVNAILKSLREGFSTLPATKSNNAKYDPLTEADKENMTEAAIKNYEEKAKQGLLFGDRDLSALYQKIISAFTPGGADGTALRNMGITTSYTNGLTQIEIDETKLRTTLTNNPDSVRDAFTKVSGEGSTTNGLMTTLKAGLDTYASVDSAKKGILITKAGSKYSALSLLQNSLKSEIDTIDKQIERWQDKMSNQVDYYTRQFTQLETLIARLNEQSNSIANLMGSAY